MCGICGIIGKIKPETSARLLRRMNGEMRHRGPDDEGIFVDGSIAIGMRRLSIIDIDGGHQPVFNEDRSIAVVFNGEIYNYRSLRQVLRSHGHTFRTATDTEIMVHAYEQWGDDCVRYMEGMFAFAVAEMAPSSKRRVLLARDRLGIKPLYYAAIDGTLVFASEVRALLASGLVQPRLSQSALRSYLLFGSVVEPATLIDGVYSLPPGHRLAIDCDAPLDIAPDRYWDFVAAAQSVPNRKLDRIGVALELRARLEETVDAHLVADVPLGVFLSSGIDSTALAGLAAEKRSAVHTVTLAFPEREFNESAIAHRTAQRLGTQHQELELRGDDMLSRLGEAVGAFDQPSMDGINSYFVSWAARQAGLKVALSGLGGDEIFGGYRTFRDAPKAQLIADIARRMPQALRSTTATLAEKLLLFGSSDARHKLASLWRDPSALPHPYYFTRLLFSPQQVSSLMGGDAHAPEPWRETLERIAADCSKLDDFTAVSALESQSYMANTLLRDTDGMSMAHSLEVRVPFLSHPLVEFVSALPGALKSDGIPKSLLVEAVRDLLPDEVISQPKRTFTLPWEHWLRGPLREEVAGELSAIAAPLSDCLDPIAVSGVWESFLRQETSWSRVWSLFVLSKWSRQHLGADSHRREPDHAAYAAASH